jgi:arginase family enzyme
MLDDKNIPWYKSDMCRPENIPRMKREIERHMFPDDGKKHPYWLSFDIDSVCATEFKSTGTPEEQGISLDFMMKFFESFIPEAVGMDFTEVNFLQSSPEETESDFKTVRMLVEHILD